MHELSIALSIVDECSREARSRGSVRVSTVYLKLGPLSGVVQEALTFSYDLACEGTILAGSRLIIEQVPVVVYCAACDGEKTLASMQQFCCPECGANTSQVLSGRELEIVAIEIEESAGPVDPQVGPSEFQEVSV